MSYTPSLSFVRLQELKLWQGSYDNLLQKQGSRCNSQSDNHHSGVSPDVSLNSSSQSMEKPGNDAREWDKKKISPSKPFDQLLEEKLAEDTPYTADPKPKRPFLRKGEGLARFRLGAMRPSSAGNGRLENKRRAPVKAAAPPRRPKSANIERNRKRIVQKPHPDVDLSPLTLPDFVKPRGTWKQVFESSDKRPGKVLGVNAKDDKEEVLENYDEFRKSLGSVECLGINMIHKEQQDEPIPLRAVGSKHDLMLDAWTPTDAQETNQETRFTNQEILEGLKAYAKQYFDEHSLLLCNDVPDKICSINRLPKAKGDLTLEESKTERELRAFEILEKKTNSNSFCSTNTSVINLLASTPQKIALNFARNKISRQEQPMDEDNESVFPQQMRQDIQVKIQEVSDKADVLQKFLKNLNTMGGETQNYSMETVEGVKKIDKTCSRDTSFSDENSRWSSRSPSVTDNYTEYDTTYQNSTKVDAGVNTSFDRLDETVQNDQPCEECEELRSKYSNTKLKLSEEICENTKLNKELKDLHKEYDKLKKQTKKDEEKHREKLFELQKDLDNERKKFAKEQSYFESYIKEAQNRSSKKDREEIRHLKQELLDLKELVKLKDTKTGATQARLRTQIKQQEKEISEHKITVEKLQRENAKLTANQKYSRRPQEVKMLHEINKNLSKLAEETLKSQVNKTKNCDDDKECRSSERSRSQSSIDNEADKENKILEKNVISDKESKNVLSRSRKDSSSETLFNETPAVSSSIEQEYENMFGHFSSPRNVNASTSVEKTERKLPDGSIEIKYSNGNLKTISGDGKFIKVKYFNGDIKETNVEQQIIRYHYAAGDSWHTQFPDGIEVMEFKDGQKCTKFNNGKTEVCFPDGSVRDTNPDGTEETRFPDGRKTIKNLLGETIILLPNGQREIHTQEYKRREYPDGTIRTLHKDGTVETVYANGRVRLKGANGDLIMDTHSNVD